MRGDNPEKYHWTVDNLETGFNSGVTFVAAAVAIAACASFVLLLFGFFRAVRFADAVLWMYVISNALSFVAVAWDKAKARTHRWRMSEATLHLLEGFGGFFGSFLAQELFRHKTRSVPYRATYLTIVAIHFLFWIWWSTDGAHLIGRMLEKHGFHRESPSITASPETDPGAETTATSPHFTGRPFDWAQPTWPIWFPWTVLLPVPLVAAVYERSWRKQFGERKRRELGGQAAPPESEIADWRSMYRWRYVVGVAALLGKPFCLLLMMAMVAGAMVLSLWIWNAGEFSPASLVLGAIALFVIVPIAQAFYHAACDKLETLNLARLMATGREDVSRMIGVQLRMDDATDIAKDYISEAPGDRIYQVISIVGWPSLAALAIAALLKFFGVIDVAWLLGNWGGPAALAVYSFMSVFSFVKVRRDKRDTVALGVSASLDAVERRKRLVAESELHCLEMLGGFVGSFVAQHLLRHKINDFAYQYVFWTIVAFHMIAWVVLLGALQPVPLTGT